MSINIVIEISVSRKFYLLKDISQTYIIIDNNL